MHLSPKLLSFALGAGALATILGSGAALAAEPDATASTATLTMSTNGAIDLGPYGTVDPDGSELAAYLGLDTVALAAKLAGGESLAEIANDQLIVVDDLRWFLRGQIISPMLVAMDEGLLGEPEAWTLISQQFRDLDNLVGAVPQ